MATHFSLQLRNHWPLGRTTGKKNCVDLWMWLKNNWFRKASGLFQLIAMDSLICLGRACGGVWGFLGPLYYSGTGWIRVIQRPVGSSLPSTVQCRNIEDKYTSICSHTINETEVEGGGKKWVFISCLLCVRLWARRQVFFNFLQHPFKVYIIVFMHRCG